MSVTETFHIHGGSDHLDWSNAPHLSEFNGAALKVDDVDVHYCLLEIPVAQAIAALPPGLHPSIPGVIATLHFHCPESDVGAFDLITVAIFCRSAAKHRMMTLSAFTNTVESQRFFRDGWAYPVTLADIKFAINYDQVRSQVSTQGKPILEVVTNDPLALTGPGASVRYAQNLNRAHTPQGSKLVQVDIAYEFKRSARGRPRFQVYDGSALGDTNPIPQFPISGTLVNANVVFDPVRFLADPNISAEAGGITMLQARSKSATEPSAA